MVGNSLKAEVGGARKAGLNAILLDRAKRYVFTENISDLRALITLIERWSQLKRR